jgi:PadR family transcriptional regulator, regulatory protein PadR
MVSSYILRNKVYGTTMIVVDEPRRSIERELKRGSLELIVLHLLAPGEAYGYEIVSKLTAQTNGALEVTDGTLYPVLYRLERAGYVAVRWETPARGVPRKYYELTDSGRKELERLRKEWRTFATAMANLLNG